MIIFVTGGAGFIGANFLHRLVPRFPEHTFVNVDVLTYAGNPLSLAAVATCANYAFEQIDIRDYTALAELFAKWCPEAVIHFAAESHVDRSLVGPAAFVQTNIVGTFNLLECCRQQWLGSRKGAQGSSPGDVCPGVSQAGVKTTALHRFHHISTDEVYGSLGEDGRFTETTAYDPSSPYSASKAGSDHLVRAYARSYGLNVTVTNCSNNYGPRQFPEKLIPLMILNAAERKPLPVYGEGANVRDWLYVDDHCDAIWEVFTRAPAGSTYNVGGDCEMRNLEVVEWICDLVAEYEQTDRSVPGIAAGTKASIATRSELRELITFVKDRPGHDYRYAMDISRITAELGWRPRETFASGLRKTIAWYLGNPEWVAAVRSGDYRSWLETNYSDRR